MKVTDIGSHIVNIKTKAINQFRVNALLPDKLDISLSVDNVSIERFVANPDNPYLISFPRTGSHWLRMLMELYFERPTLVRNFYYPKKTNYLLLHSHDDDLGIERRNIIYLYRDPVETVYSQLRYHEESIGDRERITYWSGLYGRHLNKWLCREQFTTHKTIISYEGMEQDLDAEFTKVVTHFGETFNPDKFERVACQVTKEEVKRKTSHDSQVVQLNPDYQIDRVTFRQKYGALVWKIATEGRTYLMNFFGSAE